MEATRAWEQPIRSQRAAGPVHRLAGRSDPPPPYSLRPPPAPQGDAFVVDAQVVRSKPSLAARWREVSDFLTPPANGPAGAPFSTRETRNLFRAAAWFAINVGITVGAACAAGAALPTLSAGGALAAGIGALGCQTAALLSSSPRRQMVSSAAFSALMGISMVPFVNALGVGICGTAAAYTGALAGALVTTALVCERGALQRFDGMLTSALIGLMACSLATSLMPASWGVTAALSNVELMGGLALFSAFVAVDASALAADAESPDFNPVHRGMGIYVDVLNLFVRLAIMLEKQRAREERNQTA